MIILGVTFIGIMTKLLIAVNVLVCILLIFVVLLQRPKTEGLGAAFGGDTASNIFGAQTTNVLVNLTRWLAGIFMVVTLLLSILYSKNEDSRTAVSKYIETERTKKKEDEARKSAEEAAKAENENAEDAKRERAAVVAWLREVADAPETYIDEGIALRDASAAIERGEHRREENE